MDVLARMDDGDFAAELTLRDDGDADIVVLHLEREVRCQARVQSWPPVRPDLHPYVTDTTYFVDDQHHEFIGAVAGLVPPRVNRIRLIIGEVTRTVPIAGGGAFVAILRAHAKYLDYELKFMTERVVVVDNHTYESPG